MPSVASKNVELKVIALLLKSPTHIRALDLDLSLFAIDNHKLLASLIKEYITKYKEAPTIESLKNYANTKITNEESVEKLVEALQVLLDLPQVEKEEAVYYFDKLNEYKLGRDLFDISEFFRIEYNKPDVIFSDLRDNLVKKLLSVKQHDPGIIRGNVFTKENILQNLKDYQQATKPDNSNIVKYGIKQFDDELGGMLKSTLTLVYSAANVGKSILGINIAYNCMLARKKVLYISLEMSHSYLSTKLFSRVSLLDSKEIQFGKLTKDQFTQYVTSIKKYANIDSDIYIVDISDNCTVNTIRAEIENYLNINGVLPDLVIIDHVGKMYLDKRDKSSDRSYKYDVIFSELQNLAKYYKAAFFTMFHESRKATLEHLEASKKSNDSLSTDGLQNIAESNAIGKHIDTAIRLKQTEVEKRANKIICVVDKSRFTGKGHRFMLNCYLALTYIGDDKING